MRRMENAGIRWDVMTRTLALTLFIALRKRAELNSPSSPAHCCLRRSLKLVLAASPPLA